MSTKWIPALAGVALLVPAAPAAAAESSSEACSVPSTSRVFARFGDRADYFLAAGGSFEGGLSWSESGSVSEVLGNEPFLLAPGVTSVRLRNGGRIRSPRLCVTSDEPHLRFVARAQGSGQLDVEVRVFTPEGEVTDSSSGSVSPSDHDEWAPSRRVDLKTDKWEEGETGHVDVSLRAQGDWLVDDVFVDPHKRG